MIEKNLLTSYQFKDITGTPPSTWDLSPYIPEGVLLLEHLKYRWRTNNSYWTNWQDTPAFDEATQVATAPVPAGTVTVEFKRTTPRDHLVRDPLDKTSRVAQPDLQINADQGMMVAVEWAAEYGVDGHAQLVSGEFPRSIGVTQHSQLHFDEKADYRRKVWNFSFTGGYIAPEHVKAQIKVDGVWQGLLIDYVPWAPDRTPSSWPYRLIGPYQLYLDFPEDLIPKIEAMVIYRRTPREFAVNTPVDKAIITGPGMFPTATQAFFIAVELGEEMNRNVPACECQQVLTSKPYPVVMPPESMSSGVLGPTGGRLVPNPSWTDPMIMSASLLGGQLRAIVQKYGNIDNNFKDEMQSSAALVAGELKVVIAPYTYWPHEDMQTAVALTGGSLQVVVVPYINWPHEDMQTSVALIAGTLV